MQPEPVYSPSGFVAGAIPEVRAGFIRRTYAHLGGAILAFVLLEMILFQTPLPMASVVALGGSRFSWMIVLVAFMGVSWVAERWATSGSSISMQYAGLGLYVVAEAVIFMPLLMLAAALCGPETILSAAMLTLLLFTGLTVVVFTTRKDFTWLGGTLKILFFVALGIIAASMIFGFTLGVLFSAVMVVLAGAAILYNTSNVLHRYGPEQHVAASLSLFASVALLFWYILRIFMGFSRRS